MHLKKMVHAWSILLIAMFMQSQVWAAFEYQVLGWPSAMANIGVVGDAYPDRILVNPALIKGVVQPKFTLHYQRPFQGLDLQAGTAALLYPILDRAYAFQVGYFGDEYYSEWRFISATSWSNTPDFRSGISMAAFGLQAFDMPSRSALTLSISLLSKLADRVRIGSVIQHIIQTGNSLHIPQKFQMGMQYSAGAMEVLLAFEKEASLAPEICLGLLLTPVPGWQFALGYRDLSQIISGGWRVSMSGYSFNYTCRIHPELPISHGLGFEVELW